ncbi:hypothetical protein ACFYXQ_46895 [Nocardia jiangxiensis]|uniref:Uncharacterized protein n=1 Tax=Nocardia jiangxiensis TaxID=282685 RepID=A0ABW6SG07_9NOCA
MPDNHASTAAELLTHTIFYGANPNRPLAFTVPPVEATRDTPLPDAGLFLRICAGVDQPATLIQRATGELVGVWRHVYEQRPKETDMVNELLNLYIWFIDREAGGHTTSLVYHPHAQLSPSTYGQWAAWLVWKYLLYALRQNDTQHHDRDAVELNWCIESFNGLAAAVQAGRLRLPEQAGDEGDTEFPPRRVWPMNTPHGLNDATISTDTSASENDTDVTNTGNGAGDGDRHEDTA